MTCIPVTQRQTLVLCFIRDAIAQMGYPPTLREIGVFMGIRSTNGVNDHLRALEKKGLIDRDPMVARAIRLTDLGRTLAETFTRASAEPENPS